MLILVEFLVLLLVLLLRCLDISMARLRPSSFLRCFSCCFLDDNSSFLDDVTSAFASFSSSFSFEDEVMSELDKEERLCVITVIPIADSFVVSMFVVVGYSHDVDCVLIITDIPFQ